MRPPPQILDFAVVTVRNGEAAWQLFGGVSNTDPRLSDTRAPKPHTHPMSDVSDLSPATLERTPRKDAPGGYVGLSVAGQLNGAWLPYGTTALTACQGNDGRLSDARAPQGAAAGDLAGTFPAPTVAGLLGALLPPSSPSYALTRDATGAAWAWAEVVPADDFRALRDQLQKLLIWVLQTFGDPVEGLEEETDQALQETQL
jgi:hypothetical protein